MTGPSQLTATISRDHHILVSDLIESDPFSEEAAQLRAKIARMEQRDPTLIVQRCALMAAHTRPIGGAVPEPLEGIVMR